MHRFFLSTIAVAALTGFTTKAFSTEVMWSQDAVSTNHPKEACPWAADMDAVKAAPGNHKVIFENEHVRVLEVTIPPHSREPIHAHCWPSTLYVQQAGEIIDRDAKGNVLFDSRRLKDKPKTPFVQWSPAQAPHSVENLDDQPMKLIRIENKE